MLPGSSFSPLPQHGAQTYGAIAASVPSFQNGRRVCDKNAIKKSLAEFSALDRERINAVPLMIAILIPPCQHGLSPLWQARRFASSASLRIDYKPWLVLISPAPLISTIFA
jgi:hypothetical protein